VPFDAGGLKLGWTTSDIRGEFAQRSPRRARSKRGRWETSTSRGVQTRWGRGAGWLTRAVGLAVTGVAGVLVMLMVGESAIGLITRNAGNAVTVELSLPQGTSLPALAETSEVVGPDGTQLAALHAEVNRSPVSLEQVPEHVWRAVLAAEDRRFFQHNGYDVEGISRALVSNLQAGAITQGGSTITQQLAKAAVGNEKTLQRKFAELIHAMGLEQTHDKQELLERYLNQVYFGAGAYGITAAAEEFFASKPAGLRVEQAALLAGQIRSPARMDPRDNPQRAKKRRNQVLSAMVRAGWLPEERGARLRELPLGVVAARENTHRRPYIVEAVKQEFFSNPAFGDTRDERIDRLFSDGLRITTTIDPRLQQLAERIVRERFPNRDGITASIAAVDPRDGRVLTAAFGRDFARQQFNLALQGRRQPGSAFKPFVMTAALERGLPPDLPVEGDNRSRMGHGILPDYSKWVTRGVRNYEGASYRNLTMVEALHNSVNTAFAQLGLLVGMDRVQDVTRRLGIDQTAYVGRTGQPESNPSIALGGLARGVSPVEMASAYGTFANAGTHVEPHVIAKVEDRNGNVIYEADEAGQQALDPPIAARMVEAMKGVVQRGTATAARLPSWPVAGKTGTTQNNKDVWFVGYTPNMSTAVWIGHPSENVSLYGLSSSGTAAPLWRDFMSQALGEQQPMTFPQPASQAITASTEQSVTVPSVRGESEDEAIGRLTSAGLAARTLTAHHETVPRGSVVWQSPNPGSTVSFGSAVRLGISAGPPPEPEEPDPDDQDEDHGQDDGDTRDDDSSSDSTHRDPTTTTPATSTATTTAPTGQRQH